MIRFSRRRALRGMLGGGAVTVGLPLLNCFLNGNGNALASGEPMPVRFGTWFWGLGMTSKIFVPKKTGADFDLPEELESLAPVRDKLNLFTNMTAFRDATENLCHYTGWVILLTGNSPNGGEDRPRETIDVTIANQIGRTTRFKLLTANATGNVRHSFSYENQQTQNPPEWSPVNFYTRLFGPDFPNPNAPTFTPNPRVMVRKSALSGVMDGVRDLERRVGAEDKQRLDQYFTGVRHLERQFDQQLTKPKPIAACAPGTEPAAAAMGNSAELVSQRHRVMTDLMMMAIACDQTRVFNMAYSQSSADTFKPGYDKPHHTATHEDRVDEKLGYQVVASWFVRRAMEEWAYYVDALSKQKEGDGTLLDNVLVYAVSDSGYARTHTLDGMPMFTAGRAGGRVKTGLHVNGGGTAGTRLGYTAMRVMGVEKAQWGSNSNTVSQEIGDILV
ncbi:MAG: DUF1552 domain-containing protein [Rhodospirillaceae bacterium]